jgi:ParB family chromosome partitioning protein
MRSPVALRELPLASLRLDPDHPPLDFPATWEDERLLVSVRQNGILMPLHVRERGNREYVIVDGRRRYRCAQALGEQSVCCCVHPDLGAANAAALRFVLHRTVKPWTKAELAAWARKLKG